MTEQELKAYIGELEDQRLQIVQQGAVVQFGDRRRVNWTLPQINEEIVRAKGELYSKQLAAQGASYIGLSGKFTPIDG